MNNISDVQCSYGPVQTRLRVLWAALKYAATGKGLTLTGGLHARFDPPEIAAEQWASIDSGPWTHYAVTFDGKEARGFVNGERV